MTTKRKQMARVERMADLLADLDRVLRADTKRGRGAPHDLSFAQSQVLAYVAQETMPSQLAIAGHLHVTGATVVRTIDALERKGLVTRTRGRPDRRLAWITLTEEGAHAQKDFAEWQERRLAQIIERLPTPTVDALMRNLSAFLAAQHEGSSGSCSFDSWEKAQSVADRLNARFPSGKASTNGGTHAEAR